MPAEMIGLHRLALLMPGQANDSDRGTLELMPRRLARNHVVGFEQLSEHAHPFITMRSRLIKRASETGERVFAVTSAQPGNGKTHVAVNLAAALSRITPTLLVDLDLRHPSVATRLGMPTPRLGVDDFLNLNASWPDIGRRIQGFDLHVYPGRARHEIAEDLLGSERLRMLFDTVRSLGNDAICIVDLPPVAIDDDFTRIAPLTDGVLMVVEEGRTSRRALTDALRLIHPVPLLGTVLNKSIGPGSAAPYYAYYRREAAPTGLLGRTRALLGRTRAR